MPALGIVCEITGERLRIEQCISCAQDHHARGLCTLEPAIIRAMWEEEEADLGVRVTRLTGCLRGSCLQNRVDFWWTTDQLWNFFRGRLAHKVAEEGHLPTVDHCIAERRYFIEVDGTRVSGQPDLIYPFRAPPKIIDFKSTERLPDHPHTGHIRQTNYYRILVSPELSQFAEQASLEILYFTMGGRRRLPVPLWPVAQAKADLRDRLAFYLEGSRTTGWLPDILPITDSILCGYCPVAEACVAALGDVVSLPKARHLRPGRVVTVAGGRPHEIVSLFQDGAGRRWGLIESGDRPYPLERLVTPRTNVWR